MTEEKVAKYIKLRQNQWRRLALLQAALEDKMGKKMSMDDLIEQIVDDFLEAK